MNFKNNVVIENILVKNFWKYISLSENIKKMYEETQNVFVTLVDGDMKYKFIYFKAKTGVGIRILDEKGEYGSVIWKSRKSIGGHANGEYELRRFQCILSKLKKAINYGQAELSVEISNFAPSEKVPLTEIEKKYVELLLKGETTDEILKTLSISEKIAKNITKSLKLKLPLERSKKLFQAS